MLSRTPVSLFTTITAMTLIAGFAQNEPPNAAHAVASAIPFDRWISDPDQTRFQWSVHISSAQLDYCQRLAVHVAIQVDGNELLKRRSHGRLAFFVRFIDGDHREYQNHDTMQLNDVTDAATKLDFVYTPTALVVPGNYRVDLAILDTGNGEHATMQRTLRVSPVKNDPLPDSWRDLLPVEFIEPGDPPDVWFQPHLTGQLHLPLELRRPVRIEVVMNASPITVGRSGSARATGRNLDDLLPALKVISQMGLPQGTLNVSLLDLTRRKVVFAEAGVNSQNGPLDWSRLRAAIVTADPNKIDIHALEDRQQNAQFFVEQVAQRIAEGPSTGPSGAEPAVIVLSAPMQFDSGDDLRPIQALGKANARVFYIRCHGRPRRPGPFQPLGNAPNRRNGPFGYPPQPQMTLPPAAPDELAPLLKPLQPRIFDVYDAEEFRKALADVMKELARL